MDLGEWSDEAEASAATAAAKRKSTSATGNPKKSTHERPEIEEQTFVRYTDTDGEPINTLHGTKIQFSSSRPSSPNRPSVAQPWLDLCELKRKNEEEKRSAMLREEAECRLSSASLRAVNEGFENINEGQIMNGSLHSFGSRAESMSSQDWRASSFIGSQGSIGSKRSLSGGRRSSLGVGSTPNLKVNQSLSARKSTTVISDGRHSSPLRQAISVNEQFEDGSVELSMSLESEAKLETESNGSLFLKENGAQLEQNIIKHESDASLTPQAILEEKGKTRRGAVLTEATSSSATDLVPQAQADTATDELPVITLTVDENDAAPLITVSSETDDAAIVINVIETPEKVSSIELVDIRITEQQPSLEPIVNNQNGSITVLYDPQANISEDGAAKLNPQTGLASATASQTNLARRGSIPTGTAPGAALLKSRGSIYISSRRGSLDVPRMQHFALSNGASFAIPGMSAEDLLNPQRSILSPFEGKNISPLSRNLAQYQSTAIAIPAHLQAETTASQSLGTLENVASSLATVSSDGSTNSIPSARQQQLEQWLSNCLTMLESTQAIVQGHGVLCVMRLFERYDFTATMVSNVVVKIVNYMQSEGAEDAIVMECCDLLGKMIKRKSCLSQLCEVSFAEIVLKNLKSSNVALLDRVTSLIAWASESGT